MRGAPPRRREKGFSVFLCVEMVSETRWIRRGLYRGVTCRPDRGELENLLPPHVRMEPNICITVLEIRSGDYYGASHP